MRERLGCGGGVRVSTCLRAWPLQIERVVVRDARHVPANDLEFCLEAVEQQGDAQAGRKIVTARSTILAAARAGTGHTLALMRPARRRP